MTMYSILIVVTTYRIRKHKLLCVFALFTSVARTEAARRKDLTAEAAPVHLCTISYTVTCLLDC